MTAWWQSDIGQAATRLALFAIIAVLLLSAIQQLTAERITENERQVLLQQFEQILGDVTYDNQPLNHARTFPAQDFASNDSVTVYPVSLRRQIQANVFSITSPNGYNGSIKLLVGVDTQQQITGVRVLNHKETPGLGDRIELAKSDWILGFNAKSLQNPTQSGWTVKKEGGDFDQFTGATITPRAIVATVQQVLLWTQQHHAMLLKPAEIPHE